MISGSTRGCPTSAPDRFFMIASRWCPRRVQCRDGGGRPQRESSKERCSMSDALREKLVQAGRVLVSEDQGDYVAGHVTVRLPDGDGRFLMKPAGIGHCATTASSPLAAASRRRCGSCLSLNGPAAC